MALINVYVQYPELEKEFKSIKRQLRDVQESIVILEEKVDALQPTDHENDPRYIQALEREKALTEAIKGISEP